MKDDMIHPFLNDEDARLDALRTLDARSRASEPGFERLTRMAKLALDADIATVTLISRTKQLLRAAQGLDIDSCSRDIAFCNHTIRSYDPLVVEDATRDPRFADNPLVTGAPHIRSYAGWPLTTSEGYNLGAFCVIGRAPRAFRDRDIAMLHELAKMAVDQFELRSEAITDHLTGVSTRRAFLSSLEKDMSRDTHATLAVIDLDHFKAVNDTHGHPVGDRVLEEFGALLGRDCRRKDTVGRLGGEEFAVFLPEASMEAACAWAERTRVAVENHRFADDLRLKVTMSVGLAQKKPGDGRTATDLLAAADKALYRAKRAGRNMLFAA